MATADEIKIRIIAKDEASKVFRNTEKSLGGMKTAAKAAGAALVAIGSSQALNSFVRISMKFESMRKSLETVTGSAGAANKSFALITKAAQEMPFSVQELTASFIKMRSLGIQPTEETLKSFANTASATGKSFDQFAEAVADAMTFEFERLKEFGIKASQEGDKVSFTFQGMTTTIGKNSDEIVAYLKSIGEVQFAGAAIDQMDTLSGSFSNFGDAIDQVVIAFGELDGVKQIVNSLAEGLRELAKWIRMTGDPKNIQSQEELADAITATEIALEKARAEAEKFSKIVGDSNKADVEAGIFSSQPAENVTQLENKLKGLYDQLKKIKEQAKIDITGGKKKKEEPKTIFDLMAEGAEKYKESLGTLDDQIVKATQNGFKTLEDAMVDTIMGTKSLKDSFKDMAKSIISDIIRIQVRGAILGNMGLLTGGGGFNIGSTFLGSMFGNVSTAMQFGTNIGSQQTAMLAAQSFSGGGYTGTGGRSGGIDGKGGFPAILHPNETVIDHTQGQSGGVTVNQTINVTTGVQQTVRTEIMTLLPQIAEASKAAVLEARLRGGSYASAFGG